MDHDFKDLTLLELLPLLLRHPRETISGLVEVARTPADSPQPVVRVRTGEAMFQMPHIEWKALWPLVLPGSALIVALIGSFYLFITRGVGRDYDIVIGSTPLLVGAIWTAVFATRAMPVEPLAPLTATAARFRVDNLADFVATYWLRIALFGITLIWALGAWLLNTDRLDPANRFTPLGVLCWIMSIVTLTAALAEQDIDLGAWFGRQVERVRRLPGRVFSFRLSWTLIALAIIVLIGAGYRLGDLQSFPPDLTSDHVEKLLDAVRVYEGQSLIFFPNNGGREGFQMYYLAALKSLSGLPFTFELLKLGSGLEGMVTILLAFWLGRALLGEEDRELGNLTGLLMAAMVATSYWHTLISRLGLRIVLTPLITIILLVYLTRALRFNRRNDYLIAGFVLGSSMYMYQANRMLPLVAIAGLLLALLLRRREPGVTRQYLTNFAALVVMALIVFVPLGHFSWENPDAFWMRTTARLFGDADRKDPETSEIVMVPFSERLQNFRKNWPGLFDNMRRSLLMFNWRGDSSWFNGGPQGAPAMDFFTGAMFIIGLVLLAIRAVWRRDPVDSLIPISIVIMLLPAALAVAFSNEVPGFTRASGALPMAYFAAAFGLAAVIRMMMRRISAAWARLVVLGILTGLFIVGAVGNSMAYFVDAMANYRASSLPHRQAGEMLGGFVASTGAPGNAFMLSYEYWWDHRALAIESGDVHWPNTVALRKDIRGYLIWLMQTNIGTKYALKPDRQVMFFLNQADSEGLDIVKDLFPGGITMPIQTFTESKDFVVYAANPPGCEWIHEHIAPDTPECPSSSQ